MLCVPRLEAWGRGPGWVPGRWLRWKAPSLGTDRWTALHGDPDRLMGLGASFILARCQFTPGARRLWRTGDIFRSRLARRFLPAPPPPPPPPGPPPGHPRWGGPPGGVRRGRARMASPVTTNSHLSSRSCSLRCWAPRARAAHPVQSVTVPPTSRRGAVCSVARAVQPVSSRRGGRDVEGK